MIKSNKYNAKTETQLRFAERIEKDLGLICDFSVYIITRGRGWSKADGSASSSVALQTEDGQRYATLVLYHPLRDYLVKKKYISSWVWGLDTHIEIENKEPVKRDIYDIKFEKEEEA